MSSGRRLHVWLIIAVVTSLLCLGLVYLHFYTGNGRIRISAQSVHVLPLPFADEWQKSQESRSSDGLYREAPVREDVRISIADDVTLGRLADNCGILTGGRGLVTYACSGGVFSAPGNAYGYARAAGGRELTIMADYIDGQWYWASCYIVDGPPESHRPKGLPAKGDLFDPQRLGVYINGQFTMNNVDSASIFLQVPGNVLWKDVVQDFIIMYRVIEGAYAFRGLSINPDVPYASSDGHVTVHFGDITIR